MIEQLEDFDNGTIAVQIMGAFDSSDMYTLDNLFKEKRNEGFNIINLLVKVDEINITDKEELENFYDDFVWNIRNINNVGRIAFIGDSKYLKSLVSAENLFQHKWEHGHEEKYFESNETMEAYDFALAPSIHV